MAFTGKTHFQTTGASSAYRWVSTFYDLIRAQYDSGGDVWWVCSTQASATDSAGYGRSPDAPFKTLNYAVGTAAAASNGDVVIVLPTHVETITAAAGCNLSTAGVRVVGIGTGRLRPQINYTTAAGASFDINGANCSVENLFFTGVNFASLTAMINVKAADFRLVNCELELANATNQAVLGILTTASANRMLVQNCHFHGTNNAGTTNAIQIVGGTDARILDNEFQGAYASGTGAIQVVTTAAVNLLIGRNRIQNLTANCTKAIVDTITASTGQIWENRMQILSGTAPISGATFSWVGANYYGASLGAAGTLI